MITRSQALEILNKNIQNKNLIKHALSVEKAMEAIAIKLKIENSKLKIDKSVWCIVGLLHDADWEQTQNDYSRHGKLTVKWIKALPPMSFPRKRESIKNRSPIRSGMTNDNQEIIDAILCHNYKHNGFREPQTEMEWTLYCCDELTGLIIAVALIKDKKLSNVTVESVLKKFPQKSFAAGVDREQIKLCEEKLGIKLEEFILIILHSMQSISRELNL